MVARLITAVYGAFNAIIDDWRRPRDAPSEGQALLLTVTEEAVITGNRGAVLAEAFGAALSLSALILVITGDVVEGERAAHLGIADIIGTGVLVITGQALWSRLTDGRVTCVAYRAGVLVITGFAVGD